MAKQPTPQDEPKTEQAAKKPAAKPATNGAGNATPAAAGRPAAKPAAAATAARPEAKPVKPASKPLPTASDPRRVPAGATTPLDTAEELEEESGLGSLMHGLLRQTPSWLTSMVVHMVVIIIMLLMNMPDLIQVVPSLVATNVDKDAEELEEIKEEKFDDVQEIDVNSATEAVAQEVSDEPVPSLANDPTAAAVDVEMVQFSDHKAIDGNLLDKVGAFGGHDLSGRGDAGAKGRLLAQYGGTPESERAVALALEWLAAHQLPDGSWSFDHRGGACQGRCGDPGALAQAKMGATAMGVLPFLGAGMTHQKGKYKQTVQKALYYLVTHMKPNGSMHEAGGSMYSHGLASIALCEAYAMTQDKGLRNPAQAAVNFIVDAQDPVGGGWRYNPKMPGDTSVVGWQLMALKSAHMAYLAVPPKTILGANNFLNSVQSESGAKYGYTAPGGGAARTAVGLLCRMYLGWKRDHGALESGVEYLSQMGPSRNNMYYNYYATQVLHHYEGEKWVKWNKEMRDFLVNTQDQEGHEKGSWFYKGDHGSETGGRLYTTSMCCMTLEVYYRHLPIYRKQAADDEFDN